MENKFLCFNTGIDLIFVFIIAPIICFAVASFISWNYLLLILLTIPILGTILILKSRKVLFSKILLNEDEIARIYKTEVINIISWQDLEVVRVVPNYHMIFLKENITQSIANTNWKTNILFVLTKKKLKILNKYKNYFRDKLLDVSILGEADKRILLE